MKGGVNVETEIGQLHAGRPASIWSAARVPRSGVLGLIFPFLFPLFSFLSVGPALAQQAPEAAGRHEATIAGDYFGAGSNLAPGSAVEGDAFVAGGQVLLQTPVNGDALLSGGSVSVSAPVGDDLYVAGGEVLLEGNVAGNARIAGHR